MNMAIIGICGKMGSQIYNAYQAEFKIYGIDLYQHAQVETYADLDNIIEKIDVVVDFSSPDCYDLLVEAIKHKIPILSGTTGYSTKQIEDLKKLAIKEKSKFIWKANYAKGIKLFTALAKSCKADFPNLDFVEIHATTKKDKPSGTAKILAEDLQIAEEKIQSLRLNQAPAIHEITFSSADERLILRHEILNKNAFVVGFDEELRKVIRGD